MPAKYTTIKSNAQNIIKARFQKLLDQVALKDKEESTINFSQYINIMQLHVSTKKTKPENF